MARIYRDHGDNLVEPMGQISVVRFLGDPAMTGNCRSSNLMNYHVNSMGPMHKLPLFATNYGLSDGFHTGTTHILTESENPNHRGYVLIQLTDMIIDAQKLPAESFKGAKINVNPEKMAAQGNDYLVFANPASMVDMMAFGIDPSASGILPAKYRMIGLGDGELPTDFFRKIRSEAREQREARMTPQLIDHVNDQYYGRMPRNPKATIESMRELFVRRDVVLW